MLEIGDRIYGTNTIRCTRTNCVTEKESVVELKYYAKYGLHFHWWFYIVGGPTGYESFDMDSNSLKDRGGWSACGGTKDRWDSLYVPFDELSKAILYLRELIKAGRTDA